MRGSNPGRRIVLSVSVLAAVALSLPLASPAAVVKPPKNAPRATTGAAQHVERSSALLTAVIVPNGKETSYYFQYGRTTAYGLQTPTVSAGSGVSSVKVGQAVSGLQASATYHYRVVAVSAVATKFGRDRTFSTKGNKLRFVVPKRLDDVFGSPAILSGSMSGLGNAGHRIVLQASPFPFLESFTAIGVPGVTDGAGRFSFRIANLSTTTQFRLVTLDVLPLFSPVVVVRVAVHVDLRVRSSGHRGLVRLYGTVKPAVKGARVSFQVLKAIKPDKKEQTTRWTTQFTTSLKRGTSSFSRFSMVVKVRKGGRYRAYVKMGTGGLMSGYSRNNILLHSAGK
jgi:hypothetical protein